MPILAKNKDRYPKNWKEISLRIREREGNKCKFCGIENGAVGWRDADGNFEYAEDYLAAMKNKASFYITTSRLRIVLTVAHLDHIPENCDDDNLAALCQRCHLRYDAPRKAQDRKDAKLRKQPKLPL